MRKNVWSSLVVTIAALALALPACNQGLFPDPAIIGDELVAEYLVRSAAEPAALALAANGDVFYAEKETGKVRVIVDDELQDQPLVDLPVNNAGERGLVGIALHPDFDDSGRVYVFYSRSDSAIDESLADAIIDNRVVYFSTTNNVASSSEVLVASLPVGDGTRLGGRIAFDDDGHLLVALGDMGDMDAALDDSSLAGKILRYNDDGTIPDDNPDPESAIYASGVRNPTGLAPDANSGRVFFLDQQGAGVTEINSLMSGANYGWPVVVGLADSDVEDTFVADNAEYEDPLLATSPVLTRDLVGLSVNPSTRYGPGTYLNVFFGDSDGDRLVSAGLNASRTAIETEEAFAIISPGFITDVAFTPAGTLYFATRSSVLRVVPNP